MSSLCMKLVFFFLVVCVILIAVLTTTLGQANNGNESNQLKLIIDHDGGVDDAMAIFIALLHEKNLNGPKVLALTTANGNVNENQVFNNTQRILDIAQRRDVPIHRGSHQSLVTTLASDFYYGEDGLGDSDYHREFQPIEAASDHAVMALIEYSKIYEGELIVISIGPLTNIAMATKLDPGFIRRLKHLYIAAGHIHDEHHTGPEFNALVDVEAYYIIAENSDPDTVTAIPFSRTNATLDIPTEWRVNVLGSIDTEIMQALNQFERSILQNEDVWDQLDPVAMAVVLNETTRDEMRYSANHIVLCGEDRGKNTNNLTEKEEANVRILYSMNEENFKNYLYKVFSSDL